MSDLSVVIARLLPMTAILRWENGSNVHYFAVSSDAGPSQMSVGAGSSLCLPTPIKVFTDMASATSYARGLLEFQQGSGNRDVSCDSLWVFGPNFMPPY